MTRRNHKGNLQEQNVNSQAILINKINKTILTLANFQRWVFADADMADVSTHGPVATVFLPALSAAERILAAKVAALPGFPITRIPTFLSNISTSI